MIGKLKEKAIKTAISKLEETVGSGITEKLETFKDLKPSDVQDNEKYNSIIINPLWEAVKLQSGGAITAASKFIDVEAKFKQGLLNIRDELIQVEGEKVALDPDFQSKAVPTLISAFQS